ncbi:MAG: LPS assembly lipoprotein LptE [Luteolibacter sp.]
MKFTILLTPVLLLASCAGYHLGETKPAAMKEVKTIDVRMFSNSSLLPRANAVATSAVATAIVQDGTYRIASLDKADAILEGNVASINYQPIRGRRFDTLRPEELTNTVTIGWKLLDARDPTKIIMSGTSRGVSEFFATSNLQTDRNNALADATERAGVALVSTLADGY